MSINKDQVKGRVTEAEGKIKEVAGKLVGNEKLEDKGRFRRSRARRRQRLATSRRTWKTQ